MSYLSRKIEPLIKSMVAEKLPGALEKILPGIVEAAFRKKFAQVPDRELTEIGFNWALALSLRDIWPDVSNKEAVLWLREYIEAPYGAKGHDWSAAAAKTVAQEYVNEVGEIP